MKKFRKHVISSFVKKFAFATFAVFASCTTVSASFEDFLSTLDQAGFDTQTMIESSTISRYDTARLLNIIECEDCINPSLNMIRMYTPEYRSDFSSWPQNAFHDIGRGEAYWQGESYYYCVSYVGDHDYMRGYPIGQSPICEGDFCGGNNTTTAEYLQVITNILGQYSYNNIQAPWLAIQAWANQTTTLNTYYQTIVSSAYKQCPTGSCTLRDTDELQAYLSYCRYHLDECSMESLADVPQGSWPVSELNFLRQQTILTDDMLDTLAIHHPITGRQALELAYRAFGKTSCTVNNDYDCDGRINSQDNCSATYNPSQTDTDDDGMGDVCDDDIDNDGLTNPVGIVDEWNTINIDLIDETDDQCLWDATPSAICSSIPWYGLRIQASLGTARNGALPPLSAQAIQYQPGPITWSINGTTLSDTDTQITYQPTESGLYIIQAQQPGPHNTATASSSIWITDTQTWTYMMRGTPTIRDMQGGRRIGLTHLTNMADVIYEWIVDGEVVTNDTDNTIMILGDTGMHTIIATIDDLTTQTSISCDDTYCINATLQTQGPWEVNTPVAISTSFSSLDTDDIYRIAWSDGSRNRYTTTPTTEVIFSTIGAKKVQQTITLFDGTILVQSIRFVVSAAGEGSYHIFNSSSTGSGSTNTSSTTYGSTTTTQTLSVSACLMLQASETTLPDENSTVPNCYNLYESGEIDNYQCDMDEDGTPDICDADMDGDGVNNPIGILIGENDDCSITEDIVNRPLLWSTENTMSNNTSQTPIGGMVGSGPSLPPSSRLSILMIGMVIMGRYYLPGKIRYRLAVMTGLVSVPVFLYAQYTTYVPIEPAVIHKALETNTRSNPRGYLGFNNLSCSLDNCPFIANTDQIDTNLNGVGNICEALIIIDTDGDGIPDDEDECPTDPTNTCTTTTIDTDGDGIPDDEDSCPLVYGYVQYNGCPGDGDIITGSTTIVIDTDGDGIPDDEDECPTDPTNTCTTTTTTTTTTGSTISNTQLLLGFDACEDTQPHITITECNLCPCQYAGFDAQIQAGDSVRAKLLDPTVQYQWSLSLPWMVDTTP